MHTTVVSHKAVPGSFIDNPALIAAVVDRLYDRMLADYRINRFFFTRPAAEQGAALQLYLNALLSDPRPAPAAISALLDDYFTVAFARSNAKPSLVTGRDFSFLLDIVGGREIRPIVLVSPAHAYLMRLLPEDEHFDVVMAHLVDSLDELAVDAATRAAILQFAESGRESLLGRGVEIMQAA